MPSYNISKVVAGVGISVALTSIIYDNFWTQPAEETAQPQSPEFPLSKAVNRPFTCVVKLGGSACTNKNEFETFNEISVAATARQLRDLAQSEISPLLIHGAGSFGHFQAREYSVAQGGTLTARLLEGFARTRASVVRLNSLIVDRFVTAGLAVVGISPGALVPTANRSIVENSACAKDLIVQLEKFARLGLTPIVHGDTCLDEKINCTILSGDALFIWFCRVFRPRYGVFLTDVAGVYTRPPNEEGAELLTSILVDKAGELVDVAVATSSRSHDVTGGIRAKLRVAGQVAGELGIPVFIVQVGSEAAAEALRGIRPKKGTTVERVS